jgi:hypothetical protein
VQLQQVAAPHQPDEADSAELDAPRGCFKEPVRVIVLTDFDENTLPRRLRFGVCFSTAIIGACPNENFVSRHLAISDYSDRLLATSSQIPGSGRAGAVARGHEPAKVWSVSCFLED